MFLEIAGLDSDSGVILGDFVIRKDAPRPLLRLEMFCAIPPLPGRVSRRPAGIPGESRHLGLGLGFDGMVKHRVSAPRHERFPAQSREGLPDSISGLIMGDSSCGVRFSPGFRELQGSEVLRFAGDSGHLRMLGLNQRGSRSPSVSSLYCAGYSGGSIQRRL